MILPDNSHLQPETPMKNQTSTNRTSIIIPALVKGGALVIVSLLALASSRAQTDTATPAVEGTPITLEARGHGPVQKTTRVEHVEGPKAGSTAIQVTIPDGTEGKKYRVNAMGAVSAAISAEQPVTVTFMARSPESNKVLVMVHNSANPDRVKAIQDVSLTPEWETYTVKGGKPQAFAPGEAYVEFMMGERPGVIEISNVVLTQ